MTRLNAAIGTALAKPKVREAFAKLGAEPAGGSPADFGDLVKSQVAHWKHVIAASGMQDAAMSQVGDFKVTLLGTGGPTPRPDRFGPSTLIEAGDQKLLIDAGRGATIRLYQLGVPLGQIDAHLAHALSLGPHRWHSRSVAHGLASIALRHSKGSETGTTRKTSPCGD